MISVCILAVIIVKYNVVIVTPVKPDRNRKGADI